MSESAIRAKIQDTLEGVTGIGAVHDYDRYPRSLADYFTLMTMSGNGVNGWSIHRESTTSSRITIGPKGQIERRHTYRITGIYALDDAAGSEKDLQALVDAIFDAFKADPDLGGTCFRSDLVSVDSVGVSDLSEFGADLYHVVSLGLAVYERV